jgi:hypothetical protein
VCFCLLKDWNCLLIIIFWKGLVIRVLYAFWIKVLC